MAGWAPHFDQNTFKSLEDEDEDEEGSAESRGAAQAPALAAGGAAGAPVDSTLPSEESVSAAGAGQPPAGSVAGSQPAGVAEVWARNNPFASLRVGMDDEGEVEGGGVGAREPASSAPPSSSPRAARQPPKTPPRRPPAQPRHTSPTRKMRPTASPAKPPASGSAPQPADAGDKLERLVQLVQQGGDALLDKLLRIATSDTTPLVNVARDLYTDCSPLDTMEGLAHFLEKEGDEAVLRIAIFDVVDLPEDLRAKVRLRDANAKSVGLWLPKWEHLEGAKRRVCFMLGECIRGKARGVRINRLMI
jgi:hypothetical protein